MKKRVILLAIMIPMLALANEKFTSKVNLPHIDQFTATKLIDEGHCIAGVAFVLKKGTIVSNLAKKVEKRLKELKANAWVLVDYQTDTGLLTKSVKVVQVLPLQCDQGVEATQEDLTK